MKIKLHRSKRTQIKARKDLIKHLFLETKSLKDYKELEPYITLFGICTYQIEELKNQ